MAAKVLAYVLAGGESSRMQQFGSEWIDKALLLLEGRTLLERALTVAGAACPEPRILCGPPDRCARLREYGLTVPDQVTHAGPVGALHAALQDAAERGGDWVLLLPVDSPWLTSSMLTTLIQQGTASEAAAACMCDAERVQPLPCLVHVDALPLVESALARRELKLLPLLQAVCSGELAMVDANPGENSCTFWNINTPADYTAAQADETAGGSLHQSKHGRRAAGD